MSSVNEPGLVASLLSPLFTYLARVRTTCFTGSWPPLPLDKGERASDRSLGIVKPNSIRPVRAPGRDSHSQGIEPADLPVQTPTKSTSWWSIWKPKALGLDMPASVLARADELMTDVA